MLGIFKKALRNYQLNGYKVLIVDDQEESCFILSKLLTKKGINYQICKKPQQAYWEIYDNDYDMVLLDIMMPKISGFQLLEEVRRDFSMVALPIIVISAKRNEQDIEKAFKLGANDYITKPINFATAWARIQNQLDLIRFNSNVINENLKGSKAGDLGPAY